MAVDWPKCWGWATNVDMLRLLQRAVSLLPGAHELQHKLNAMDLGAQQTYQGGPKLGKFRQRLERAHARLHRLQKVVLPLDTKVTLVQGCVSCCHVWG